ncbi:MAG: SPASM domain-containing protein [Chitinophagaceae bacterium]|nr:SPASM domain-containing protein [Chitinophagaceae bacterium]
MYVEKNGIAQRKMHQGKNESFHSDIDYLKKYFVANGNYPMFTQVLLETRTDCNRKCKFCPQAHFSRPLRSMDWNVFTKVIDDLAEMEFSGRVALYMTNEPLIEPRLIEMIKYARIKSARFFIDITTNGKNLSSKLLDELFLQGLDNININDYRSDRKSSPDKISKSLEKTIRDFKSNPKVTYNKRSTVEVLSNYAGIIKDNNRELLSKFCNYPFRKLAISAEGNIILCCNDYIYKTNFGNVLSGNLSNIWNSEALNNYRNNLLNETREGICIGCDEYQNYSVYS